MNRYLDIDVHCPATTAHRKIKNCSINYLECLYTNIDFKRKF